MRLTTLELQRAVLPVLAQYLGGTEISSLVSPQTRQTFSSILGLQPTAPYGYTAVTNRQFTPPGGPAAAPVPASAAAIDAALADAKVWTSTVAMHLADGRRRQLFRQLDGLHDISEWEAGDQPANHGSFQNFLRTMIALKPDPWPNLGLSYDGNIVAAWGKTLQDRVSLEFFPTSGSLALDQVKWALTIRLSDQVVRNAGVGPSRDIERLLGPYNPAHWFHAQQTPPA